MVSLAALLLLSVTLPSLSLSLSLPQGLVAAAVLCSGQCSVFSGELSEWELCPLAASRIMRNQGQTLARPIPELQSPHFE